MPPKVPQYPRPVSSISGDEIPVSYDTIVYYDPEEDVEQTEMQRAAKRRRIEAHATNYMRGQSLFILTAGLKGPFGDGWRNPWAQKKTAGLLKKTHASKETRLPLAEPINARKQDPQAGSVKRHRREVSMGLDPFISQPAVVFTTDAGLTMQHVDRQPFLDNVVAAKGPKFKSPRVEDWLKTNEAYDDPLDAHPDPSPSSPSAYKSRHRPHSPATSRERPENRANGTLVRGPEVVAPGQAGKGFSSPVNVHVLPRADATRDIHTSPIKPAQQRMHVQRPESSVRLPSTDHTRAEYSILEARRRIAQPTVGDISMQAHDSTTGNLNSASVEPQLDLSTKLAESHSQETGMENENHLPGSGVAVALLVTAQEEPSSNPPAHKPSISEKQTNESNLSGELPSAQIPDVPFLPSLPSNISSHDHMLQESAPKHATMASEFSNHMSVPGVALATIEKDAERGSSTHDSLMLVPEKVTSANTEVEVAEKEAQTRLAMVSPSNVVPGKVREARKSTKEPFKASAAGIRKTGPQRSRKRQSLAVDDKAPVTIKSTLNVAKQSILIASEPINSKAVLLNDEGCESDENQTQGSIHHEVASPTVSRAISMGILKASLQQSVEPFSTNRSGSLSTKQEAQHQKKLKLVGDEDFDLDAAIDDLGSYLDTWDAEKQAAGIV